MSKLDDMQRDRDEWRKKNLGIIRKCVEAEHECARLRAVIDGMSTDLSTLNKRNYELLAGIEAEREACAKVAEQSGDYGLADHVQLAERIAAAIRARSKEREDA